MPVAKKAAAKKTATPTKKIRPAAKPAAAPAKKAAKKVATKAVPVAKPDKAKKPKLVRDSYTIPKAEYAVLDQLKARAATLGRPAKKSELLRAGLKALAGMEDTAFIANVSAVPAMKTGRPAKG
jgi:hypothetical protein